MNQESMKFYSGAEMYNYLINNGDLYNPNLEIYVFLYNDAEALCIYRITPEEAEKLDRESRETGEYWSAFLGAGGQILDIPETGGILPSIEFCEKNHKADGWVDTKAYNAGEKSESISQPALLKIKIPNGYLMVEKKGAEEDYPGVFISFSEDGKSSDLNQMIACVEYDSVEKEIKTETYSKDFDEPNHIICYEDGRDLM